MPVEIRRGSSRFVDRSDRGQPRWSTAHAFSFGEHYDPALVAFGPMVCHDDHRLAHGSGFPLHHHAGLTIVTWVLAGAVRHADGPGDEPGRETTVQPGEVAVLHAGAGVDHAESSAAPMTRFVQVWLTAPDEAAGSADSAAPTYAVTPVELARGDLVEVARPQPGSVFSVARLTAGQSVTLPQAPLVHAFVGRGTLLRSSLAEPLSDGDAFLFTDEPAHEVTSGADSELLVWTFG